MGLCEVMPAITRVQTMLVQWGEHQRASSGAMPGGYNAAASFLSDHAGRCDACNEPPASVLFIERELCKLKRLDERVYLAVSATYISCNDAEVIIAARLRVSKNTLRERRQRGEFFIARALEA